MNAKRSWGGLIFPQDENGKAAKLKLKKIWGGIFLVIEGEGTSEQWGFKAILKFLVHGLYFFPAHWDLGQGEMHVWLFSYSVAWKKSILLWGLAWQSPRLSTRVAIAIDGALDRRELNFSSVSCWEAHVSGRCYCLPVSAKPHKNLHHKGLEMGRQGSERKIKHFVAI